MFETLTVREILESTARLKLPESVKWPELRKRVDHVIDALDIRKCCDTRVSGCSGGEKRRLAVAAELLGDPFLLFLDEPTSGLDAFSALNVLSILSKLARTEGRTIICTIHQPRASLMTVADQLVLLADGRQIYTGKTWTPGKKDGLVEYFTNLGFPCPPFENPADHVIDLVNEDAELEASSFSKVAAIEDAEDLAERGAAPADDEAAAVSVPGDEAGASPSASPDDAEDSPTEEQLEAREARRKLSREEFCKFLADKYRASDLFDKYTTPIPESELPGDPFAASKEGEFKSRYPTGFCTQVSVIVKRVFLFKLREPEAVVTQAFNLIFMSALIGWIYWDLPQTLTGANDRMGFTTLFLITVAFSAIDLLLLFPKERAVYLRDSTAGLHGTLAYYVGRSVAETPAHIILSALGACIGYWMAGFQDDAGKFGMFVLNTVLLMLAGTSLLIFVSTMAPDVASANGLGTVMLMLAMIFCSFFVSLENTPVVFRWIGHISFLKFGLETAVVNELSGMQIQCSQQELALGCLSTGDAVLALRGISSDTSLIWPNIGWLALQIVIFRIISFFPFHFLYTGQPLHVRWKLLFEW
jgi:ABC-type multidrug transport system ATPase subunit/ABC-type multidrug transport system permease subunit